MQLFKKICQHKCLSVVFGCGFAFILGGLILAVWRLRGIKQPLILHFNDYAGISRTGDSGYILWIGALSAIVVAINFLIALELAEKESYWGKFATAATLVFAVLIFIGFAAIINVN